MDNDKIIDQKSSQGNSKYLVRYTAPTNHCMEPYGQIWQHMKDDGEYDLWIEVGKDEVKWIRMGEFLEMVYKDQWLNEKFMTQALDSYERQMGKKE